MSTWWSRLFGDPPGVTEVDTAVANEKAARSELIEIVTALEATVARLNALPEIRAARTRRKGDKR